MKKSALLLLPLLTLCSCGANVAPSAPKAEKHEIVLTMDNYWSFIDVSCTRTTTYSFVINYSFKGVLSYAYYDNVYFVIDYRMHLEASYSTAVEDYQANLKMSLNAAGSGEFHLDENYIPDDITPECKRTSFYGFERTTSIKSVHGKVVFSI